MNFKPGQRKLLVLLLITDLAFLGLHLLYRHSELLPAGDFSLSRDRGYGEFFQYTKELWTALLFLRMGIRGRRGIFIVFSSLFAYFLIDDSIELHENFGAYLADFFGLPAVAGLRPVDLGELAVYGYFALLFSIAIGLAYFRSDPETRRPLRPLIVMVVGLALFGVLLDMLGIIAEPSWLSEPLNTAEEFGEMVILSVITAFAFGLEPEPPQPARAELAGDEAVTDQPAP